MKLRALRLHNVKRFAGRGIAIENIGDGVNVLTAANEFGKSTSFEALHALFFQPHTGTPASVQMLRPYAGGNPLVEADIESEDGAFRLTKQFYSGRQARVTELSTGRLVAQADEAEKFIADLTRGGAGGPSGLLWVRQGLTGLEKRSKSDEESDRRVRETLLSSVQGEVEALTGGRRMAEILSACEEALARFVTAGMKPKAGGPYREALDDCEELEAREKQLAAEVTLLRDALDRRRAATRRLAEIEAPDEVAARAEAITTAEAAYRTAQSHSDALRAAEADLALAEEQYRTAAAALMNYENALTRASVVERQSGLAIQRLHQAEARHNEALAENDRLQAAMQAAEADERTARENKSMLDAAEVARDAAERYAVASDLLDQAVAIRTRIETGEALLAALQVPEKAIEQLEALDIELVRLHALQSTALPSLRMAYANPADPQISLAGKALTHDSDQVFSGTIELDIAHLGRLTIRSQHVDDAAEAITLTEGKIRSLLAGIGVDSLAAARQRQANAREKSNELVLERQMLKQIAPEGVDTLRETVTRLDVLRGDALEIKFDASAIIEALRLAEVRITASRNEARQVLPLVEANRKELLDAHAAQAETQAELRALESTLGPVEQRQSRHQSLASAAHANRERRDVSEASVAPLRATSQDLAVTELALKRVRAVAQAAEQEIKLHSQELADLNGQIRVQANNAVEETWLETQDLLSAARAKARRYDTEVKTLDRLRQALTAARSSARDLYLKPVITELRPLISLLFDDISVAFNEDTLLPETVLRNGQQEEVDRLSGGMREQLSILTRLAFARLLARNGRPAPVILDDALVYSDDDRIERMFEALHSQSRDQQILVFSCRQRAFSKLGGNVLTMSDWSPT